jgi:hypothetical protein
VKGDSEGELDTGEQNSIEVHGTRFALLLFGQLAALWRGSATTSRQAAAARRLA